MSMIEDSKVICPLCGKINWYIKTVSINFTLEPEMLRPGAMDHLNDFRCSRCGLRISAEKMELYVPLQKDIRFQQYMAKHKVPKEEWLRFFLEMNR